MKAKMNFKWELSSAVIFEGIKRVCDCVCVSVYVFSSVIRVELIFLTCTNRMAYQHLVYTNVKENDDTN